MLDRILDMLKLLRANAPNDAGHFGVMVISPGDLIVEMTMHCHLYGLSAGQHGLPPEQAGDDAQNPAASDPYPHGPTGLGLTRRHQSVETAAVGTFVDQRLLQKGQQVASGQSRYDNLGRVDADRTVFATVVDPEYARGDRTVLAHLSQDLRFSTKSTLPLRISASAPKMSRWERA